MKKRCSFFGKATCLLLGVFLFYSNLIFAKQNIDARVIGIEVSDSKDGFFKKNNLSGANNYSITLPAADIKSGMKFEVRLYNNERESYRSYPQKAERKIFEGKEYIFIEMDFPEEVKFNSYSVYSLEINKDVEIKKILSQGGTSELEAFIYDSQEKLPYKELILKNISSEIVTIINRDYRKNKGILAVSSEKKKILILPDKTGVIRINTDDDLGLISENAEVFIDYFIGNRGVKKSIAVKLDFFKRDKNNSKDIYKSLTDKFFSKNTIVLVALSGGGLFLYRLISDYLNREFGARDNRGDIDFGLGGRRDDGDDDNGDDDPGGGNQTRNRLVNSRSEDEFSSALVEREGGNGGHDNGEANAAGGSADHDGEVRAAQDDQTAPSNERVIESVIVTPSDDDLDVNDRYFNWQVGRDGDAHNDCESLDARANTGVEHPRADSYLPEDQEGIVIPETPLNQNPTTNYGESESVSESFGILNTSFPPSEEIRGFIIEQLQRENAGVVDENRALALLYAIYIEDQHYQDRLNAIGVRANVTNDAYGTLMHLALEHFRGDAYSLLAFLIAHGGDASLNQVDRNGFTVLALTEQLLSEETDAEAKSKLKEIIDMLNRVLEESDDEDSDSDSDEEDADKGLDEGDANGAIDNQEGRGFVISPPEGDLKKPAADGGVDQPSPYAEQPQALGYLQGDLREPLTPERLRRAPAALSPPSPLSPTGSGLTFPETPPTANATTTPGRLNGHRPRALSLDSSLEAAETPRSLLSNDRDRFVATEGESNRDKEVDADTQATTGSLCDGSYTMIGGELPPDADPVARERIMDIVEREDQDNLAALDREAVVAMAVAYEDDSDWDDEDAVIDNNPEVQLYNILMNRSMSLEHNYMLQELIRSMVNLLSLRYHGGRTPLHLVTEVGNNNALNILLVEDRNRIFFGVRDDAGNTPLHLAIQGDYPNIVETLLNYYADARDQLLNIRNNAGLTPAELVQIGGQVELNRVLQLHDEAARREDMIDSMGLDVLDEVPPSPNRQQAAYFQINPDIQVVVRTNQAIPNAFLNPNLRRDGGFW